MLAFSADLKTHRYEEDTIVHSLQQKKASKENVKAMSPSSLRVISHVQRENEEEEKYPDSEAGKKNADTIDVDDDEQRSSYKPDVGHTTISVHYYSV